MSLRKEKSFLRNLNLNPVFSIAVEQMNKWEQHKLCFLFLYSPVEWMLKILKKRENKISINFFLVITSLIVSLHYILSEMSWVHFKVLLPCSLQIFMIYFFSYIKMLSHLVQLILNCCLNLKRMHFFRQKSFLIRMEI